MESGEAVVETEKNICHLIPYDRHEETIRTLYFVYEKNFDILPQNLTLAFHKMYIVTAGKGTLKLYETSYPLRKGDIFFVFPSVPHSIRTEEAPECLQCIYISFVGIRANQLLTRYHISAASPVYSGYTELIGFWESALSFAQKNNLDVLSESVLLYTFSVLGLREKEEKESGNSNLLQDIKRYIDENYSDQTLSLNTVCTFYHYNPKYISNMFKKYFRVGFNEYLNALRIHEACRLIRDNHTSVKDIAAKCGFRDQYYFSRVFKEHKGMSPRQYITEYQTSKK